MRIVVIRNAFTHDFGGAERLSVHLAKELILNGIDSMVISRQPRLLKFATLNEVPNLRGWWWPKQNWSGKNITLFPLYFVWQIVLTGWYLFLFVRSKPDVVHIMSKDDFIAATIASSMLGKRVFWTDTADLKYVLSNHKVWYKNPVGKMVFAASKLASQVEIVSHSEKKLIAASLGKPCPKNYQVVHIAGKNEIVKPFKRSESDEEAVIFCTTSRLVTAKGIGELIEAFNKLCLDSKDYRLWLVGDGKEQNKFKELANDNPNIVFIGHSNSPLSYVASCDIFVQPTYHEAFSLSLTEAAMLGKPMIATDVGGNPELVNSKNGLLIPPRDAEAIYEAMKRLGSSRSLREFLGKNARNDYVEKFDFCRTVKTKLIPLYEQNSKN